jgi:hypothetical protein
LFVIVHLDSRGEPLPFCLQEAHSCPEQGEVGDAAQELLPPILGVFTSPTSRLLSALGPGALAARAAAEHASPTSTVELSTRLLRFAHCHLIPLHRQFHQVHVGSDAVRRGGIGIVNCEITGRRASGRARASAIRPVDVQHAGGLQPFDHRRIGLPGQHVHLDRLGQGERIDEGSRP